MHNKGVQCELHQAHSAEQQKPREECLGRGMVPDFPMAAQASRGTFQDQKPEFRASVLQKRSVSRGFSWVFHGSSIGPTVHLVLALSFFGRYIVGGSAIEEERAALSLRSPEPPGSFFRSPHVASSATSAVKKKNPTASQA